MRIIGFDIHRAFAEAVAWEDGKLRRLGRVDMRRNLLTAFAVTLSREDIVVVEATGNAAAVASVIGPHVKRVLIANPIQVRMIAHAKIKTDTIDAGVLAQLYASGFLPEVWIPDEATQALRRQVTRRNQIVRQRTRLKNIIQSILHAHLIPSCPAADLCGSKGRAWLGKQVLPEDERFAVERHLREFDRLGEDSAVIERDLARSALADENVARLIAIPGIDMVVALAVTAAIGDINRFGEPQKLVSYLGLNRASGSPDQVQRTMAGSPSKDGDMPAACWSRRLRQPPERLGLCALSFCGSGRNAANMLPPSPRLAAAVRIWHLLHKKENYAWARPALQARKIRKLELKAGHPAKRGQKGSAHAYNIKGHREQERVRRTGRGSPMPNSWRAGPPGPQAGVKGRTGAANEERR